MVLMAERGTGFMDHPEGAGLQRADRVDFDPRVRLEFRGTQISSDGGLLVMRELDDALGLSDLAALLRDNRRGKNTSIGLTGCSGNRSSGGWPDTVLGLGANHDRCELKSEV
jgi:hypothetical protein